MKVRDKLSEDETTLVSAGGCFQVLGKLTLANHRHSNEKNTFVRYRHRRSQGKGAGGGRCTPGLEYQTILFSL